MSFILDNNLPTTVMEILYYSGKGNKSPFEKWLAKLDNITCERLNRRIHKLRLGEFGDCKNLGSGIFELRFHFGAGYRIYFGRRGKKVIILLCGGDKSSQEQDIKKAKEYWQDCQQFLTTLH